MPHLLLYGPPGTGKTSTILACAAKLYTKAQFSSMVCRPIIILLLLLNLLINYYYYHHQVLEINASDDNGINVVRGQILSFASTGTMYQSGYKLIILDEADAMSQDAQNALRRSKKYFIIFSSYRYNEFINKN